MRLHSRLVATVMLWNNKPKSRLIGSQSCATFSSKMPFFTNKFSPKKIPSRKADVSLANKDLSPKRIERELGPEIGPIKLRLGDQEATFDEGLWIPETGKASGTFRENEKLRKEVKKLEEENNLLKLKFELLLDMLTETTAEVHMHRGELESLRNKLSYGMRAAT